MSNHATENKKTFAFISVTDVENAGPGGSKAVGAVLVPVERNFIDTRIQYCTEGELDYGMELGRFYNREQMMALTYDTTHEKNEDPAKRLANFKAAAEKLIEDMEKLMEANMKVEGLKEEESQHIVMINRVAALDAAIQGTTEEDLIAKK